VGAYDCSCRLICYDEFYGRFDVHLIVGSEKRDEYCGAFAVDRGCCRFGNVVDLQIHLEDRGEYERPNIFEERGYA
jgi:hypothetical protein